MASRGFIDLLFILLLSTFALLSESLRVSNIETAPADVGTGGAELRDPGRARVVTVGPEDVTLDGVSVPGHGRTAASAELAASAVADLLAPLDGRASGNAGGGDPYILLIPATHRLPHQQVMHIWAALRRLGLEVRLGVQPATVEAADTR